MQKTICPKCHKDNAVIESAHKAQINSPDTHGKYVVLPHKQIIRCFNSECEAVTDKIEDSI